MNPAAVYFDMFDYQRFDNAYYAKNKSNICDVASYDVTDHNVSLVDVGCIGI